MSEKNQLNVTVPVLAEEPAAAMAEIFKGLADVTRLRLLSILMCSEMCVNDLADTLGMTQSAISHQLRVLRNLGFVASRRDGQQIYYQVEDEHIGDLFARTLEHTRHTR